KLGKYMERKVRKTEKISSILTINIKIELIFFLRKNYCPTLFFLFTCATIACNGYTKYQYSLRRKGPHHY
ncbi:hypothetical protein, partial [Enterococcus hirae]|uniref:hypothetical protein n=1 Tax=Enterococcus hirae TaxID=1354 RepID=UPI00102873FB